jgi:hypothetical protein
MAGYADRDQIVWVVCAAIISLNDVMKLDMERKKLLAQAAVSRAFRHNFCNNIIGDRHRRASLSKLLQNSAVAYRTWQSTNSG